MLGLSLDRRNAYIVGDALGEEGIQKTKRASKSLLAKVLLSKLSRLTHHLNNLRSIWDGQRAAFTEEEAHPSTHTFMRIWAGCHQSCNLLGAAARFCAACRHDITFAGGGKSVRCTRGAHLPAGWRPRAAGGE